jgi:hypothetical protein
MEISGQFNDPIVLSPRTEPPAPRKVAGWDSNPVWMLWKREI